MPPDAQPRKHGRSRTSPADIPREHSPNDRADICRLQQSRAGVGCGTSSSIHSGLLPSRERDQLLTTLRALQQPDGGWRKSALEKVARSDHSPEPVQSDGYATALVVLSNLDSPAGGQQAMRRQGLSWLVSHQLKDGTRAGSSLNKQSEPGSKAELFMSDAATGYAVLALEQAQ